MTHEQIQDLLEAYVDETLDRATRAKVDRHLEECEDCRAVLEGVPAVRLHLSEFGGFDEKTMRKAVRTTLLRLAVNVVVILFVGWLAASLLGSLVLQPLLVDRGGRAAAATLATQDLAIMYNPGAGLAEYEYDSGVMSRTSEARVVIPIGTEEVDLGTLRSRIGLWSFGDADGGSLFPYLADNNGGAADLLAEVGPGTVATVEVWFDSPLTVGEAQQLADSPYDVRVVWAGFATSDAGPTGIGLEAGGVVGYATCDERTVDDELLGTQGAGGTHHAFTRPPSVSRALEATRAAVGALIDHRDLIDGIVGVTPESAAAAADHLAADPAVLVLVATGPTSELLAFVTDAPPNHAGVRGIDFTNWNQPLCGR